jgi:hypothetical protein
MTLTASIFFTSTGLNKLQELKKTKTTKPKNSLKKWENFSIRLFNNH